MALRISTVITTLRTKAGMTQEALAKKAGLTQGYIAHLEGGRKRNPSLPVLRRLAKALGGPVTELLG